MLINSFLSVLWTGYTINKGVIYMSVHARWSNIKRKRGAMDGIRGKISTKIGR